MKKSVASVIGLGLVLALAACSKITQTNYDKLHAGMTYAQVKDVLGDPNSCSDVLGIKSCTWGDAKRHIDVNFMGDQALAFSAQGLR